MAQSIQWREPARIATGDTLIFQRNIPDYLPSDGWAIHYVLTKAVFNAGQPALVFLSVPDSLNKFHTVNIPNFASTLEAGEYTLSGELLNSGTGEKRQIYIATLELDPNFDGGTAGVTVTTHAQRMIQLLEAKLERLETHDLSESDQQRSKFVVEERTKALERLKYYREFRAYELKREHAANTGDSQNQIVPVMAGNW
jgi:acetolactate synthase regulatory subunit